MNDDGLIKTAFFAVFGFFMLLIAIISLLSIPLRTKASANVLTLNIKLQGTHKASDQIQALVDFYDGPQKATSEASVTFTNTGGVYSGNITLKPGFDFTHFYALFIKPEKYIGRVFCNTNVTGKTCTMPQMIFMSSGSTMDFTGTVFLGGDIAPANGKIDAQDMSLIMKNLGKTGTAATDLNNDGITDVVDYSLALYSLGQSAVDDTVNLQAPATLSPTPSTAVTPSSAPTVTTALTPTGAPSATVAPTAVPTATPMPTSGPSATPIPIPTGVCHVIPGTMAKSLCNIQETNLGQSADWTACIDSGGTGFCAGKSKARCTCPNEMVCSCQLQDSPTQTVNCTNGGKIEIQQCN